MDVCNCPMTRDEVKALMRSQESAERERAIGFVVGLMSSTDRDVRCQGYDFFKEAVSEALYCSCLSYGSLVGDFTEPLVTIVTRTVEFWAPPHQTPEATGEPSHEMPQQ